MNAGSSAPEPGAIAALKRFARPRVAVRRCELCALPVPPAISAILESPLNRVQGFPGPGPAM